MQSPIERLEPRQLLTVTVAGQQANVTGTSGDDVVTILRVPNDPTRYRVVVNGDSIRIKLTAIIRFNISTLQGNDTVNVDSTYGPVLDTRIASLAAGNDTYSSSAGTDIVNGDSGNDLILTGSDNDTLTGGDGNDSLVGGNGNDSISGNNGRDSITASNGNDSITGDSDQDTISAGAGDDMATGGDDADSLFGSSGFDQMDGGNGNDSLDGGADNDNLFGASGNDTITGGDGNDVLASDGEGRMTFISEPVLLPQFGNDRMDGGDGNDTLLAYTGADRLTGGAGIDILDARNSVDIITDKQVTDIIPVDLGIVGLPTSGTTATLHIDVTSPDGRTRRALLPAGTGSLPDGLVSLAEVIDDQDTVRFASAEFTNTFSLGSFFLMAGFPLTVDRLGRFVAPDGQTVNVRVNGLQASGDPNLVQVPVFSTILVTLGQPIANGSTGRPKNDLINFNGDGFFFKFS